MTSTIEEIRESKCDDLGKNNSKICCQFCPSIILNPRAGTLVSREVKIFFYLIIKYSCMCLIN